MIKMTKTHPMIPTATIAHRRAEHQWRRDQEFV